MNTLPNNPQMNEVEAGLRAAAVAVDNSPDGVAEFDLPSLDKSGKQASGTQENADAETVQKASPDGKGLSENQKVDPAKSGTKQADDAKKAEADAKAKEPKTGEDPGNENDSKFTKAKKEQERRDKSWKALEAEKEEFRKKQADLEAKEKELTEKAKKAEKPSPNRAEVLESQAKEYDQAAKDFAEEGRDDLAKASQQKAAAIRETVKQVNQQHLEQKREQFTSEWNGHLEKLEQEIPELKDPKSAMYQEVEKVMRDRPILTHYAAGIKDAVALVKLRGEARLVPDLQKKLTDAEKRIKELEESTQLPAGGVLNRGSARKSGDMTPEEQAADLRQKAAEADAQG